MRTTICAGTAFLLAFAAFGQPVIGKRSIRSVAPTSVGSGLARGSAFRITGNGLGPFDVVQAGTPYPTELAGTQVMLTSQDGSAQVEAILTEVGAFEIHAILPSSTGPGDYLLEVRTEAGKSKSIAIRVSQQNPGIVTTTNINGGLASAEVLGEVPARLRMTAPAHPGATLSILAAGFGPIAASDHEAPEEQALLENAELVIAGRALPVRYAGRYPGKAGFDRLLVDLPDDEQLALGCYVPVSLRTGDLVSNAAFIAIAGRGADICDPGGALSLEALRALDSGQPVVIPGFDISDSATEFSFEGETYEMHSRSAAGAFYAYDRFALESGAAWPAGMMPNRQGCSVVTLENTGDDVDTVEVSGLDAGRVLTLVGPAITEYSLDRTPTIAYTGGLGGAIPVLPGLGSWEAAARAMRGQARRQPTRPVIAPELPPGPYTLTGAGGEVIAAFTAAIELSTPIQWTNKASVQEIDRQNPLSILWTPGPAQDLVTVTGLAIGPVPGASKAIGRLFVCQAPADHGGLTVPAEILALMPPTGGVDDSMAFLSILHTNTPPNGLFRAPLVAGGESEQGRLDFSFSTQKSVTFH
ncbi:MAG: hypothetical protein IPP47_21395 [Bryobacterales bacterium]|nr:hypothetical protein [Bryobacterales bacterium]